MGKRFLLDTNAVIDYLGGKYPDKPKNALSKIIDDEINLRLNTKII